MFQTSLGVARGELRSPARLQPHAVHAGSSPLPAPVFLPCLSSQVFDVASFDMIAMLRLPWVPGCVVWCSPRGAAQAKLAVSDSGSGAVHIYDMRRWGG